MTQLPTYTDMAPLIEEGSRLRTQCLKKSFPILVQFHQDIVGKASTGSTLYAIGEGTISHSLAEYFVTELQEVALRSSGRYPQLVPISIPNLFAYDSPEDEVAIRVRSIVKAGDMIMVYSSTANLSYLRRGLEIARSQKANIYIIGECDRGAADALAAHTLPCEGLEPYHYVELQLALANLFLLIARHSV